MDNNRTIDQLNHLTEVNQDADAGFRTAAENVRNSEIQTLFTNYAKNHARFYAELQAEIERLGGSSSHSGTLGGALHRGWLDVKSALSGHSVGSMLTACQTAEQSAESAYLDVIGTNPTGQTHSLLRKHCEEIKGFRTRLARLAGELKDGIEFQENV
jgi:uncharacterized protein (TIGR02284 family)